MAYTAKLTPYGSYEIFQDGQRISTGSAASLSNYGLSPTQLSSSPTLAPTQPTTLAPAQPSYTSTPTQPTATQSAPPGTHYSKPPNPWGEPQGILLYDKDNSPVNPTQPTTAAPNMALQSGQRGAQVETLQRWLLEQGYQIPDGATGYFGPQTQAALAAWQNRNGVTGPGVGTNWGPKSIQASATTAPASRFSASPNTTNSTITQANDLNSVMEEYLKKMQTAGMQINPNITIDASTLQEFATLAAKEIDPFYAEQLKVGVSDFLRESGFSKDKLIEDEKRLSQKYGAATRQLSENFADKGFAQSGLRQTDERQLALDTQNQINDTRNKFQFDMGTAGRNLEQKFGTSNVPGFTLGNRPTVGAGEAKFGTSSDSPLYSLSDSLYQGIKGSNTYEQDAAKRVRQSQLAEGYRSGQSLSQIRSLTI